MFTVYEVHRREFVYTTGIVNKEQSQLHYKGQSLHCTENAWIYTAQSIIQALQRIAEFGALGDFSLISDDQLEKSMQLFVSLN